MENIKNRKLKGSVLLTVVSVMALLIIFLVGTLALATAANNRAHVNYSTAQTNITARTVVDTAFQAMGKDKTYADAISALSSTNTSLDIPVSISSGGTNTNTLGRVDSLTAEYIGKRKFYNTDTNSWVNRDLVRISADVSMGGVTSTSSVYLVKDPPAPPPGGGGGGAGFVTTGGAGFTCQSNIYGGSYINLPTLDKAKDFDYREGYDTYSGKYLTHETFQFTNSNHSLVEADAVFNGNLNAAHLSHIHYPGAGQGITIWGDLTFSTDSFDQLVDVRSNLTNSGNIEFSKMPYMYVDGEISGAVRLGPYLKNGTSEFPFNTFAGNIDAKGGFSLGGDLYLMNGSKTNSFSFGDGDRDPVLYLWSSSVINKHGDAAVNKIQGNVYSKGDIKISGNRAITFQSINCEKNLDVTSSGGLTVNGDLIVKGNITGSGTITVKGNVYAKSVSGVEIKNAAGVTIDSVTEYSGKAYPDYAERYVVLGLDPVAPETDLKDSSNNVIPKEKSQVVRRMDQVLNSVINPYTTDKMPTAMQTKRTQLLANNDKRIASLSDAETKLAGGGFTKCTSWWDSSNNKVDLVTSPTADMNNAYPVIKESCVLTGSPFGTAMQNSGGIAGKCIVFDPGAGEMLVVLDGYTSTDFNFIVNDKAGGTVYFYIEDSGKLQVPNFILTTKYMELFKKMSDSDAIQIYTDSSYAVSDVPSFTDVSLGLSNPPEKKKYAPGCRIYSGTGCELYVQNYALVTAQITSSKLVCDFDSQSDQGNLIKGKKVYYNGFQIDTSDCRCILGCLNSEKTTFKNIANMIYVPDLADNTDPVPLPDATHWYSILYYDEY